MRRLFSVSNFIIGEFARVRTELTIKQGVAREVYRGRINSAIGALTRLAVTVDYTRLDGGNYTRWLADADDEPILATALVGKARYVVSLNTKDFPPENTFAGVLYRTPQAFLEEIYRSHPRKRLLDLPDVSHCRFP